ncbi:MAG: Rieske (2Fe-2S) protein [Anaerolineae bacterium]|jgi:cytochrome b6-f complex iron-sulfur subunit
MSEKATRNETKVTRREFLWYAWLSSMALFMAGSGGATIAYAYPRFREGEFGGKFTVGKVEDFPEGSVTSVRDGKFFLVREGGEFTALYQVCTHLGCLVRQVQEDGFICPCHGSKFAKDGTLVRSPAPRDMDGFPVEVINGEVVVDTGTRLKGESRTV